MANTIMTAKNTFAEGLIMDFAPDNTQATCMTSALNATLLTFNGNEMSLLNDMGNGRVETAFLPEGYVPVGTCEFGDIIYIVSYNPLTNKSLIGCFPSPERNISSEEVGQLGQKLSTNEFLNFVNGLPTGELKNTSVKKIIFEKRLNPGDKYIIYSTPELLYNYDKLSDFGNTNHLYNDWPKLLKLHVVAIEDSGKINYLDTDVTWYENVYKDPSDTPPGGDGEGGEGGGGGSITPPEEEEGEGIPVIDPNRPARMFRMMRSSTPTAFNMTRATVLPNDYFIQLVSSTSLGKPDIDSYRSLVSSAYSVFQSKVSGKLAILAELEKISGFSCTHNIYTRNKREGIKDYEVYLNSSWVTDNYNVNPSGFVVTDSKWVTNKEETNTVNYKTALGDELVSLPINAKTNLIEDRFVFTTNYDLANPGTYENFINNDCYNALVKNFEKAYLKEDLNYMPRKINLMLDSEGFPNEGHYYINAFSKENNKIGFHDSKGLFIELGEGYSNVSLTDTFVHNYFGKDITKRFYTLPNILTNIGNVQSDLSTLVHLYTICPAMPYGYLLEYAITNVIDFSKVGSGLIELNEWRYYNDGEISTLTFGIEAYPEENKGISRVDLEFYDNQGLAAILNLSGKQSYSGTFTEVFLFNSVSNRNISSEYPDGNKIKHRGDGPYELTNPDQDDIENMQDMLDKGVYIKDVDEHGKDLYWVNDAGIIYPNLLYHVIIKIYYQHKNVFGEYDNDVNIKPKSIHRWYWSNNMFNEYYHNTKDFSVLNLDLNMTLQSAFESTNDMIVDNDKVAYNSAPEEYNAEIDPLYLSLGYNRYYIDSKNGKNNLRLGLVPTLEDSYDTFTILPQIYTTTLGVPNLQYKIWEGNSDIQIPESITLTSSKNSPFIKHSELLYPIEGTSAPEGDNIRPEPTSNQAAFETWALKLKEWFTLSIDRQGKTLGTESIDYVSYNGDVVNKDNSLYCLVNANDVKPDGSNNLYLLLKGESYSKIMTNIIRPDTIECVEYRPFIRDLLDLEKYNIIKTNLLNLYSFSFYKIYNISMSGKEGEATCFYGQTSSDSGIISVGETHENFGQTISGKLTGDGKVKLSISDCMKANSVDIGPFGLLSVVARSGVNSEEDNLESEGHVMKCSMGSTSNFDPTLELIKLDWRNTWGSYCFNSQQGNKNIESYILGINSARDYRTQTKGALSKGAFTFLFVAKDETDKYIPFNAFGRCLATANGEATLKFTKAPGYDITSIEGLPFISFAEIIVSYLCLLYYKNSTTVPKDILVFDDIIINNYYAIEWHKEFIIKCKLNNVDKCIGILGIPYDEYLEGFNGIEGINTSESNVRINKSELEERSILIEFVHTIPYDILELLSIYNISLYENPIYISPDITGRYQGSFVKESLPGQEILALDIDNGKLVDYNLVETKRLVWTNFEDNILGWDPIYYDYKISDFAKRLTVKDDLAVLKMTSVPNDTFKLSYSSDDDHHDEGEQLALGFSSNIKLHKIFEI